VTAKVPNATPPPKENAAGGTAALEHRPKPNDEQDTGGAQQAQRYGAPPESWAHWDLVLGLGADLLPVAADPRATISPSSKLRALGKVPSTFNREGMVVGFADWPQHITTGAEIERWSRDPRLGICLNTRNVRALDVDVADAAAAAEIAEVIAKHAMLPKRTRSNSAKFLVLFELPGDLTKRVLRTAHGAIEALMTGQQCVIDSTHPSGSRYEFADGLPNSIPVLTAEQFERLWRELEARFAVEPSIERKSSTKAATLADAVVNDPVAKFLLDNGWVLSTERDSRLHVRCPWQNEHTTESADSASTSFPAHTGGYEHGAYRCLHQHCEHRTQEEFRRAIGVSNPADDFEVSDETAAQLRAAAEQIVEQAKADAGAPFERSALSTLRALRKVDPAAFMRTRDAIKHANRGVSVRALDAEIRQSDEGEEGPDHLAIARAVQARAGKDNLIFSQGAFWRWKDKGVWRDVDDREVKQFVQETIESAFAHTHKVTRSLVDSVVDVLKTESYREDHRFDGGATNVINLLNGELHLAEDGWQLRPHRREDYRTTQLPVAFDPDAAAPRFERFLAELFEGDADAQAKAAVLLEALGYSLLPDSRFERFVLLVGGGANGKSVMLYIVGELVGQEQASAVQPSQFGNRFQRAHLRGKLVNVVTEIAEGAEIADAELKAIVSGELTTAEHKLRPPFDFRPFATCWFATNHMPHTRDFSEALFRRAIILTFGRRFDGPACDPHLKDKLRAELPGVLNLALAGLARLLARGRFTPVESSEEAKREWRLQADQVAQFVEERCAVEGGAAIASSALYGAYERWAIGAGIGRRVTRKTFTQRLQRLGVAAAKGTDGVRILAGIRLNGQPDVDY
jgi:putative DNA primase/helicase